MTTILSLFDYSGNWCKPYRESGYDVIQIDIKFGIDILTWNYQNIQNVYGILIAPPCTDFAASGAQYWKQKDIDGRTAKSMELIERSLKIVRFFNPTFWALENPVGRLNKLFPELSQLGPWYFQPYWYGDAYTKKTGLWGRFNRPRPINEIKPIKYCKQGSWIQQLGGKSEKTKELRSVTPLGFAYAFYQKNQRINE